MVVMGKIFAHIRVLPVTIFVAALMLTVKVSGISDSFNGSPPALQVAPVLAQKPPKEAPPKSEEGKAEASQDAEKDAVDAEEGDLDKNDPRAPENDPTLLTQNEIDLLQQLAERREDLEKSVQEMSLREGILNAAEQRIDRKIQELRGLQAAIDNLIKKHDDQEETKIRSLVKIYENMKPKDAARIFEELDLDTLLLVAERMKERKLAPVMAQMNSTKAKDVTVKLATLRSLPLPGADLGGAANQ
jgi:flagellar motility protein MotE (MotC chaperone)